MTRTSYHKNQQKKISGSVAILLRSYFPNLMNMAIFGHFLGIFHNSEPRGRTSYNHAFYFETSQNLQNEKHCCTLFYPLALKQKWTVSLQDFFCEIAMFKQQNRLAILICMCELLNCVNFFLSKYSRYKTIFHSSNLSYELKFVNN